MRTLSLFAMLLTLSSAHADDKTPGLELGFGYEHETVSATPPDSETVRDSSRSGKRLLIKFSPPGFKFLRFIPLEITLDKNEFGDGFAQLEGIDPESAQNKPTRLRRLKGFLLEGNFEKSVFRGRAKLLSFDYDRDRGLWDVRYGDAEIAVKGATLRNKKGTVKLELEARAGAAYGLTKLMAFDDVSMQLGIDPHSSEIPLLIPHAGVSIGFVSPRLTLKARSDFEKRIDLSPEQQRSRYLGATSEGASERLVSSFDADFPLYKKRFSAFMNATHELDTLTLGRLLFQTGDRFDSVLVTGGIRGTY